MRRTQRFEAMKKHPVADQAQNKFASAVRSYAPRVAGKLPLLLPFKEGIAELRAKHASYKTIAGILRDIDVVVSHFTVARFCREVLELTPRPSRPRKASARTVEQHSSSHPKANRIVKADNSRRTKRGIQSGESDPPGPRVAHQEDVGGPRIADINTV